MTHQLVTPQSEWFDPSRLHPDQVSQLAKMATPLHFLVASSANTGRPMYSSRHLEYLNSRIYDAVTDRSQQRFIIIEASMRHAKSTICTHALPTWHMGMWPEDPVFIVTYSDDFSEYWGELNRETFRRFGPEAFGLTVDPGMKAAGQWRVNGHFGIMYSVGIGGLINGLGAALIVLDDPIKNAKEARSTATRAQILNFYMSTLRTRLTPWGTLIIVMARWHQDDLSGHLQKLMTEAGYSGDQWEVIHLPAIAEAPRPPKEIIDTVTWRHEWRDEMGRAEGEVLWPEMWPKNLLLNIKGSVDNATWSSVYQQKPVSADAAMFIRDRWVVIETYPDTSAMRLCRFWDTASTTTGDWTVGALVGLDSKNVPHLLDIKRVRYRTGDVQDLVLATAREDGVGVKILMEQQRAGSGNAEIDTYSLLLMGYDFAGKRPQGEVADRAIPMSAAQQHGHWRVYKAHWNDEFFDEADAFPNSTNDDQIDAVCGAFNELAVGGETAVTPIEDLVAPLGQSNPFGRW